MSSELIVHSSDADFERDVLQSDVPVLRGFLGTLVRTVQNDCTDFGRSGCRI